MEVRTCPTIGPVPQPALSKRFQNKRTRLAGLYLFRADGLERNKTKTKNVSFDFVKT